MLPAGAGAGPASKFVTVSTVRILAELTQRYYRCSRNCSPFSEQTTLHTHNLPEKYSQRDGDRVSRYLTLGDGFLLQNKAIKTENSDFFYALDLDLPRPF